MKDLTLGNKGWGVWLPRLLALAVVIVIVLGAAGFTDASGFNALRHLLVGAAGSPDALASSLNRATPLILGGLAVTVPFRAGMFNLGGEGQLYVGALAAAWVGTWQGLPAHIHVPLVLLAGFAAGAGWAAVAGGLKARFGIHELLSTIMLNYVALYLTSYLANYPLKAETTAAATAIIQETARLPSLGGAFAVHGGLLVAIAAVLFFHFLLRHTVFGYEMALTAENRTAAALSGIAVRAVSSRAMAIGGGLAGLAGAIEVAAVEGRFMDGFAPGLGFDGVTAAIIGVCQPVGTFLAGAGLGLLKNGALAMDLYAHVPREVVTMIQALLILIVASRAIGLARAQLRVSLEED
jgi:simple sugar transport system permease protein